MEVIMWPASWMVLLLFTSGVSESSDFAGYGEFDAAIPHQRDSAGDSIPIRRAAYQRERSGRGFSVRWIGQDGQDHVGPNNRLEPSEVQDVHLALGGLDPRHEVVFVDVTAQGGGQW